MIESLSDLLEAAILKILSEGKCEHCGRISASVQELELARKYVNVNGEPLNRHPYAPGEEKGPKAFPHGVPFEDDGTQASLAAQSVFSVERVAQSRKDLDAGRYIGPDELAAQ